MAIKSDCITSLFKKRANNVADLWFPSAMGDYGMP